MHEIDLRPVARRPVAAESRELFTVTGPRVRNPSHNHRVLLFDDGHMILAAQPTVIALHADPSKTDVHAGSIALLDTIMVDGVPYVVTPRALADPALIPAPVRVGWAPTYEPERNSGWYVTNVRYPSGACGCVSRNYADRQWRIVCDPRPFEQAPTFRTRDDAARAERALADAERARVAGLVRDVAEAERQAYAERCEMLAALDPMPTDDEPPVDFAEVRANAPLIAAELAALAVLRSAAGRG